MNIRQFQIFRQDLTNFNILEYSKKIGTCPCVGHPYFLVLFVWVNLPYEQNRIRSALALCVGRPKSVRSSGDLLRVQPSRPYLSPPTKPCPTQYRVFPLWVRVTPQQPQRLGWLRRWHRVRCNPKKSEGKRPKVGTLCRHSSTPHEACNLQM